VIVANVSSIRVGGAASAAARRSKVGGAGRELLAVARQREVGIVAPQHVGQIVDVERRQVLRAIDHPQLAERPGQRIAVGLGGQRRIDRGEPRTLGQEVARGDAQRQARVLALQEPDGRLDGRQVALALGQEVRDRGVVVALALAGGQPLAERGQPGPGRQRQEQLEGRIGLGDLEAEALGVEPQEPAQVRRRRVRRVELGHRRRAQEDAHREPGTVHHRRAVVRSGPARAASARWRRRPGSSSRGAAPRR
jgi:hypothetical protein